MFELDCVSSGSKKLQDEYIMNNPLLLILLPMDIYSTLSISFLKLFKKFKHPLSTRRVMPFFQKKKEKKEARRVYYIVSISYKIFKFYYLFWVSTGSYLLHFYKCL